VLTVHSDKVVFDLGTDVMPQQLAVLLYDEQDLSGGSLEFEDARVLECLSGVAEGRRGCAFEKRQDPETHRWTIQLPSSACKSKCHVAVNAIWMSPGDADGRGNTFAQNDVASWLFSLDTAG
jgi:hypothetical protein